MKTLEKKDVWIDMKIMYIEGDFHITKEYQEFFILDANDKGVSEFIDTHFCDTPLLKTESVQLDSEEVQELFLDTDCVYQFDSENKEAIKKIYDLMSKYDNSYLFINYEYDY